MQTVCGNPFFVDNVEKLKQYPYLDKDLCCEILIVGGGIDGAILNFHLSQKHDVALVTKSRIGFGASSVATSLLEWQLDDFCDYLKKELTNAQVCNIYNMGLSSIEKIEKFIKKHGNSCHFQKKSAFLFSNSIFQKKQLKKNTSSENKMVLIQLYSQDRTTPILSPFKPVFFRIMVEQNSILTFSRNK